MYRIQTVLSAPLLSLSLLPSDNLLQMENFLDEPDQVEDEERDVGPVVDDEKTALVDQEREARERFSD